jgi:hypothetical protein
MSACLHCNDAQGAATAVGFYDKLMEDDAALQPKERVSITT